MVYYDFFFKKGMCSAFLYVFGGQMTSNHPFHDFFCQSKRFLFTLQLISKAYKWYVNPDVNFKVFQCKLLQTYLSKQLILMQFLSVSHFSFDFFSFSNLDEEKFQSRRNCHILKKWTCVQQLAGSSNRDCPIWTSSCPIVFWPF